MAKKHKTAITPTREEDYSQWYQEVVKASDMAENSPVRGCMVIKPWGFALWENIQRDMDAMFKETGVRNAYFPLFIPKVFFLPPGDGELGGDDFDNRMIDVCLSDFFKSTGRRCGLLPAVSTPPASSL